jgi:hypothetical protein
MLDILSFKIPCSDVFKFRNALFKRITLFGAFWHIEVQLYSFFFAITVQISLSLSLWFYSPLDLGRFFIS